MPLRETQRTSGLHRTHGGEMGRPEGAACQGMRCMLVSCLYSWECPESVHPWGSQPPWMPPREAGAPSPTDLPFPAPDPQVPGCTHHQPSQSPPSMQTRVLKDKHRVAAQSFQWETSPGKTNTSPKWKKLTDGITSKSRVSGHQNTLGRK